MNDFISAMVPENFFEFLTLFQSYARRYKSRLVLTLPDNLAYSRSSLSIAYFGLRLEPYATPRFWSIITQKLCGALWEAT